MLTSIPNSVLAKVEANIKTIKEWNRRLEAARTTDIQFQGNGRYVWEMTGGVQPDHSCQLRVIDKFRSIASEKCLDANEILQSMGFEEPLQITSQERA